MRRIYVLVFGVAIVSIFVSMQVLGQEKEISDIKTVPDTFYYPMPLSDVGSMTESPGYKESRTIQKSRAIQQLREFSFVPEYVENNFFAVRSICGDGVIQSGEFCDTGIIGGSDGSCPTICQAADPNSCSEMRLVGTECNTRCELIPKDQGAICRAAAGPCDKPEICDGMGFECPSDAFFTLTDAHVCRPVVGQDLCGLPEQCDGSSANCPADTFRPEGFFLESRDVCEARICAANGIVAISNVCDPSDGRCCVACGSVEISVDPACFACPNGKLDPGETCDPAIYSYNGEILTPEQKSLRGICLVSSDCDDHNPATEDRLIGNPESCNVECTHTVVNEDGCCQAGCVNEQGTPSPDGSCASVCGNTKIEAAEVCDGAIGCDEGKMCSIDCKSCVDKIKEPESTKQSASQSPVIQAYCLDAPDVEADNQKLRDMGKGDIVFCPAERGLACLVYTIPAESVLQTSTSAAKGEAPDLASSWKIVQEGGRSLALGAYPERIKAPLTLFEMSVERARVPGQALSPSEKPSENAQILPVQPEATSLSFKVSSGLPGVIFEDSAGRWRINNITLDTIERTSLETNFTPALSKTPIKLADISMPSWQTALKEHVSMVVCFTPPMMSTFTQTGGGEVGGLVFDRQKVIDNIRKASALNAGVKAVENAADISNIFSGAWSNDDIYRIVISKDEISKSMIDGVASQTNVAEVPIDKPQAIVAALPLGTGGGGGGCSLVYGYQRFAAGWFVLFITFALSAGMLCVMRIAGKGASRRRHI